MRSTLLFLIDAFGSSLVRGAALMVVALPVSGCMQTAMLPAEQMEDGETTASFTVGEPGAILLPRMGMQVTHGVGRGDVTVNVSGSPDVGGVAVGGGLAARSYLTDRVTGEAQVQLTSFSAGDESPRRAAGLVLLGLQSVPSPDGGWYAGAQAGVVRGPSPDEYAPIFGASPAEVGAVWTDPFVGGTVGVGPIDLGDRTRMQIELTANLPVWGDESEPPAPANTLSVGVFGLFR
jgi:hypothetical protein